MTRKLSPGRLLVATHNAGKLQEMKHLLEPRGFTIVGAAEMNLPEPEETETTFVGNARIKAHAATKATGLPALSDDSGIEVEALDGAPGVYTADWAKTPNGRDFMMAMEKTHHLLEKKQAPHPRKARFRATMVLAWPDGEDVVFEGDAPGSLVWPPRGREGHGYDPMFVPDGYEVTFGEMPSEEKNLISHRARAVEQFLARAID